MVSVTSRRTRLLRSVAQRLRLCAKANTYDAAVPLPCAAMPAIPSPLARFYAHFPLVTVPSPHETTAAPAQPTIWAYGPPPAGHAESLDPLCRAAQAYARFIGKADAQVRWMTWEEREAAPGAALPAVHTPDGDLLVGEEVSGWFASQTHPGKGAKDGALLSLCDALFSADKLNEVQTRPRRAIRPRKRTSRSSQRLSCPPFSPHSTSPPRPSRPQSSLSAPDHCSRKLRRPT